MRRFGRETGQVEIKVHRLCERKPFQFPEEHNLIADAATGMTLPEPEGARALEHRKRWNAHPCDQGTGSGHFSSRVLRVRAFRVARGVEAVSWLRQFSVANRRYYS